jgi:hypothetical protein
VPFEAKISFMICRDAGGATLVKPSCQIAERPTSSTEQRTSKFVYRSQRFDLSDGDVDIAGLRPLLFEIASVKYWLLWPAIGKCWNVGKLFKRFVTR